MVFVASSSLLFLWWFGFCKWFSLNCCYYRIVCCCIVFSMISLLCPQWQPSCPLDAWSSWGLYPWEVLLLGRYCTHFACIVHLSQHCLHFVVTCSCAVCLFSLFVICHHSLWADLDCLLACSSYWTLLPLVQGLCVLQWLDHWRSSNIHPRVLSSWVVFCLPYTSFLWVFYKDWML